MKSYRFKVINAIKYAETKAAFEKTTPKEIIIAYLTLLVRRFHFPKNDNARSIKDFCLTHIFNKWALNEHILICKHIN